MTRRQWLAALAFLPFAEPARAEETLRIVAVDKVAAHTLLALGVEPIAAGAIKSYARLGIHLSPSVIEIGVPVEPNLELLQAIAPDLFLTHFDVPRTRARLEKIAPVVVMNIYRGDGKTLENARSEMQRVSRLLGREDQATAYFRQVDVLLDRCREAVAETAHRPLYLVQLGMDGRTATVFGANSIMQEVIERLGLRNAWTGHTSVYGQNNVGVEYLAGEKDASLVYINYGADDSVALVRLAGSPFWSHLPFVVAGRISSVPAFDVYGGFPTAERFARLLTDSLLSQADNRG